MIETPRLKLIACNKIHLENLLQSEQNLAEMLSIDLAKNWLQFPEAVPFALKSLEENPQMLRWSMHLFVNKDENKLIGNGGFKGLPDENGMVEIGYAVSDECQNQGFATEAAQGMIDYAFSWASVKMVDAHTLAEENASTAVLKKCGFSKIADKFDEEDGYIWQWRLNRENYEKS